METIFKTTTCIYSAVFNKLFTIQAGPSIECKWIIQVTHREQTLFEVSDELRIVGLGSTLIFLASI